MLEFRTIDIPLAGGQDEGKDPFLLDPPAAAEVINGRWDKDGAPTKRFGYDYEEWTPTTDPHTIIGRGSQRVVITSQGKVYRYDADNDWDLLSAPRSSAGATKETHAVVPAELQRWGIVRSEAAIGYVDCAVNTAGLACYVWIDRVSGTDEIYSLITEASSGRVVDGPTKVPATASTSWDRVYLAHVGTRFVLVAVDQAAGDIKSYYVATSGGVGTWTAGATLATGAIITNTADLCSGGATYAHLVWWNQLNSRVEVRRLDNTGTSTQSTTIANSAVHAVCVAYHSTDDDIWVGHAGSGTASGAMRWTVLNADYTVAGASASIAGVVGSGQVFAASIVPTTTGEAWAAWQEEAGSGARRVVRISNITNGGLAYTPYNLYNYCLAAQGWYDSDAERPMIPVAWQPDDGSTNGGRVLPTTQPCGFVVAPNNVASGIAYSLSCVSRFAVDRYRWAFNDGSDSYGKRQNVPGSGSYTSNGVTRYLWASMVLGESSTVEGVDAFSLGPSTVPLRRAEYEGCQYVAAGALFAYDGLTMQENTPHLAPEGLVYSEPGGTGLTGSYSWIVVWEWEDAQGVLRRSAPSTAVAGTPTNDTVRITFKTQKLRARDGASAQDIRAALYRTEASGSVYRLVTRGVPTAGAIAGDVYFDDAVADASLGENLYTEGDVLPSFPAPPCTDVLIHKQRAWVIDAERRNEVCPSKLLQDVLVAPEFPGELRVRLPRGEAVALAALDDKVVIFTADDIFVVYGEGPNNTGTQGAFSEPQAVATGVGCIDRCSVVSGDFGVMFRSRRGFELLNRSLQVVPGFGDAMQDTLAASNVITSATVVAAQNQVRFTRKSSTAPIVYDYVTGQWSKWTYEAAPLDAAMINGVYVWMSAAGHSAETTAYVDNYAGGANHIDFAIRTAWIKLAGLQGYKRVRRAWLLGRCRGTSYSYRVRAFVDYDDDNYTQSETLADASTAADEVFQHGIHLARQKVESVRFYIEDRGTSNGETETANDGVTWVGLALEVGGKKGLFKLPAANKT